MPGATAEQIAAFREWLKEFKRADRLKWTCVFAMGGANGAWRLHDCPYARSHTRHICLYVPARSSLIAGDLLWCEKGRIRGLPPEFTENPEAVAESMRRVAGLSIEAMYGYHGTFWRRGRAGCSTLSRCNNQP